MAARSPRGGGLLHPQLHRQGRSAPASPRAGRSAAPDPHGVTAVVPQRPCHHFVRGRSRIWGTRIGVRSVRRGRPVRPKPALPRRPLSERRSGGRTARHGARRGVAAAAHSDTWSACGMKVGIVGLPNAGKSSLFSALTGVAAEAANYPFTTIEPNVAVVPVADRRLDEVALVVGASKVVPDTITFHDIAGLVAGAHRGEGLGNRFLANIRETDAIVHVVRVHNDPNVVHPEGRVDPLADIETTETELIYADLEQAERRLERVSKSAKSGDRHAIAEAAWLAELIEALQAGRPARTVPAPRDAPDALQLLQPLSAKPVLFVANVDEGSGEVPPAILEHARAQGAEAIAISARLQAEL